MIKKLLISLFLILLVLCVSIVYDNQVVAAGGYWQYQSFINNGHCGPDTCSTLDGSPCPTIGATTVCCETGWVRNRYLCAY